MHKQETHQNVSVMRSSPFAGDSTRPRIKNVENAYAQQLFASRHSMSVFEPIAVYKTKKLWKNVIWLLEEISLARSISVW